MAKSFTITASKMRILSLVEDVSLFGHSKVGEFPNLSYVNLATYI